MTQQRVCRTRHGKWLAMAVLFWLLANPLSGALAQGKNPAGSEAWKVEMEKAVQRFKAGDAPGAVTAARSALDTAQSDPTTSPQHIFDIQLGLASMLLQTGATDEAKALVLIAHDSAENAVLAAQRKLAVTLKYLGAMHMMAKDYPAAEKTFRKAITISKAIHGPKHPETASIWEISGQFCSLRRSSKTVIDN